ncbi:MAG: MFS transporter [Nocardioidaceae bacterium]|nr:MFS transporter [Nocardioidaceae bacterium]
MTATGAAAEPGTAGSTRRGRALVLVAIVVLAVNLRPAVTSLGAVLGDVRAELGLTGWLAGLLTTLPVLCFAGVGAVTNRLTHRFGLHLAALISLLTVAAGSGARALADSPAEFTAATTLALAGMAVGNVSLPPLVKLHFPGRIPTVTAMYSCALLTGAALPAGVSVPVADATGTWRWGLGLWAITALVAALPWLALLRHDVRDTGSAPAFSARAIVRSPLAWSMAVFFGSQSAQAYAQFGWLPSIYADAGLSQQSAALMLTVATVVGVPAPLVLPAYARRTSDHRPLVVVFAAVTAIGLGGLMLVPATLPWLWAGLLGLGGCAFPWVLAMIALRTRSMEGTAALSAFVQSTGYLLSAIGPLGTGVLYDLSGSWTVPIAVLMALTVPMLWCGLQFARPRQLEDELAPRGEA